MSETSERALDEGRGREVPLFLRHFRLLIKTVIARSAGSFRCLGGYLVPKLGILRCAL